MLSTNERDALENINRQNGWGISNDGFMLLVNRHKDAMARGDTHMMELIEYRLKDINFHSEVRLLREGRYSELLIETLI